MAVLLGACSKEGAAIPDPNSIPKDQADEGQPENVFATLFGDAQERYLRISGETDWLITNPSVTEAFPSGSRVLASIGPGEEVSLDKSRYAGAVNVLWMEAVAEQPVGDLMVSLEPKVEDFGAPMQIIYDWITTAEAYYLTVHYRIQQSGEVQHSFKLRPFGEGEDFALCHNKQGDTGEDPAEGIVCFRLSPEPKAEEGETPRIRLHYLDFSGKVKTLVLVYKNGS